MRLFGRIFQKNAKIEDNHKKKSLSDNMHDKLNKLLSLFSTSLIEIKNDYFVIKYKIANLCETNFKLGMKLLEKGQTSEAARRFWITKKFWPKCYDAHYQHAYSLLLLNKPFQARRVLNDLLSINPDYDHKALDLLNKIENETIVTK